MVMALPSAAAAAAASAVNGGATMMSHSGVGGTSGLNASKNARVSSSVLYIFQFPAITGRRKGFSYTRAYRLARKWTSWFVGKRFHAGKFFTGEKFQRSAATR